MAKRGRPSLNALPAEDEFSQLIAYWAAALASPTGVVIASKKPNALLQKLYRARRECGHTTFHTLRLIERPDEVRIVPK